MFFKLKKKVSNLMNEHNIYCILQIIDSEDSYDKRDFIV